MRRCISEVDGPALAPGPCLVRRCAAVCRRVVLRIADPEPVARLRLAVFDTYLGLAPRQLDASLPVRIVDIDDASLARIGQWPWPRTRLAEIVEKLQAGPAREPSPSTSSSPSPTGCRRQSSASCSPEIRSSSR
ncbi:MAG: CHASE2 domain-containing protein [Hyphomicrobium sp.]